MQPLAFGALLQRYRQAAGLTQEQLASLTGYSVSHIRKLEQGTRAPTPAMLGTIAEVLTLSSEDRTALENIGIDRRLSRATNSLLPIAPTPFIGREREMAALREILLDDTRCLTLRGPGGVGKTRLALKLADEVRDAFRDGVFFVSLSALDDPSLLPSAIAGALGLREAEEQSLLQQLQRYLQNRQLLLILDTFEHLLPAASLLAGLLALSSQLRIIVTSRTALRLGAEQEFPVLPLPVPSRERPYDVDEVARPDAIQLFVQRARAVDPTFALTSTNMATVAAICRRLDGLPLAIELAAARIRLFPLETVLAKLDQRLELLTGGPEDAPARHRTLRATLDWSIALLDQSEQRLLTRLSVFAGGWTFQAVEQICVADSAAGLPLIDPLTGLLEKSLIQRSRDVQGEPYYSMLDTVRAYLLEQLDGAGERDTVQRRHALYFSTFVDEATNELQGPEQEQWLAQLAANEDNIRAALRWAVEHDLHIALQLVAHQWRFWYMRGSFTEGRRWLVDVLDNFRETSGPDDTSLRMRALRGAGALASQQGDYVQAHRFFEEHLALARTLNSPLDVSIGLNFLGTVASQVGEFDKANPLFEESLVLARQVGNAVQIDAALNNLGLVASQLEHYERSQTLFEESIALARSRGDRWNVALSLHNLGVVVMFKADLGQARELLEQGLESFQVLEDAWGIAGSLNALCALSIREGNYFQAQVLGQESLRLSQEMSDKASLAECLENLALAASAIEDHKRAIHLLGAAALLREQTGARLHPMQVRSIEQALTVGQDHLATEEYATSWRSGQIAPVHETVTYALGRSDK